MLKVKKEINKGFTLLELLVVIFIIAVLFTLIIPNLTGARERAGDANVKQAMNGMRTAARLFHADYGYYPLVAGDGISIESVLPNGGNFWSSYMPDGAAGIGFTYSYTVTGDTFRIGTTLYATVGDDDDNSQARCGVSPVVQGQYYVCAN